MERPDSGEAARRASTQLAEAGLPQSAPEGALNAAKAANKPAKPMKATKAETTENAIKEHLGSDTAETGNDGEADAALRAADDASVDGSSGDGAGAASAEAAK